jgi:UDP-GlcNAc:undecaprenyl-phosphate GlcNAc-1-phosphate transferase
VTSIAFIIIVSFSVSFLCVLTFRPLAIGFGLVDRPSSRKQHAGNVPLVGGLAIYTAIFLSSFLFIPFDAHYKMYLISTAFMVLIGALDDYHDLDAGLRLIAQFLIGSLMVFGTGLFIDDLGDIFGNGDVSLGIVGPIFTLLAVVASINAFNMTDGVDGLVGSLSINSFLSIGILALISDAQLTMELPAMFFGAIFAFLFFNLGVFKGGRYKVFMGDAGSMLMGLTIIWLLTYGTQGDNSFIKPVTVLWIIAIPLMDMFSVMFRRILAGNSPLQASRDHIHHVFLFHGFSNIRTTLIITLLSAIFCMIGIFADMQNIAESVMAASFLAVFCTYNLLMVKQDKVMKLARP